MITGVPGGFITPGDYNPLQQLPTPQPIYSRGNPTNVQLPKMSKELRRAMSQIKRGEFTGDVGQILFQLNLNQQEFQRAITTSVTAFPVRENLEAEAKILIPLDTPIRNMLARTLGSGLASKWKQLTSLGGGYAGATTVSSTANAGSAVSIQVASSAGFAVGDTVAIGTSGNIEYEVISAIADATHITVATLTTTRAAAVPIVKFGIEPGSGTGIGAIQAFFAESGSPADHTSVYVDQTASYKLMGVKGSVTGFAMAAGANFQNQLAYEKTNAIRNLMLNEENALINGDATSILAPWGDGTSNLAFNGFLNLITTTNGTPIDQVQTAVGALTLAHIDNQLGRLFRQGAQTLWMIMNEQETRSLAHLAEASGSIIRVQATSDGKAVLGVQVVGYVHPVTGEMVKIYPSRFLSPGRIIFGSTMLPDGSPAADVQVLPQVQLPQLAPNVNIQGYTAQEIAPSQTAPQVKDIAWH